MKALISFPVTMKLICAFVFAYAKIWFSHDAAQMTLALGTDSDQSGYLMSPEEDIMCVFDDI